MPPVVGPPATFIAKKAHILKELTSPLRDSSPKGGPDVQILPLLNLINSHPLLVTTSSCAGRVAIYVEGIRTSKSARLVDDDGGGDATIDAKSGSVGGKGGGGRWIYVSHDEPIGTIETGSWRDLLFDGTHIATDDSINNDDLCSRRYVHFKFEPMILHVLCANSEIANKLLGIALAAGFRESGYNGHILAVRCSLRIDAPVGYLSTSGDSVVLLVDDNYLKTLMQMSIERFTENRRRTDRFFEGVKKSFNLGDVEERVETKEERRIRKREEGLRKQRDILGNAVETRMETVENNTEPESA
ncbi:methyltransferase TYW3-domain-containing protein [Lipomyces chichibuensis]|uniref:methyltransferase TYW3-domain-containing protein n=1 Tax=Lipomyces chichibuensis TaxID=1546026 RepID=UPI003342F6D3